MIVLDTNVLSALMQAQPDLSVVAWLDAQPVEAVWITSITLFEARYGLELLPAGKHKQLLMEQFAQLVETDLENRVLGMDALAAHEAATLAAVRKAQGKPVDMRDTFIAGIVQARSATLVTRNVRHFADLTTPVVNPWAVR